MENALPTPSRRGSFKYEFESNSGIKTSSKTVPTENK